MAKFGTLHQSNFKPNCTCREVVDVLVIAPAVGETRVKAIYRSWAIPCTGKQVYAPRHRAE